MKKYTSLEALKNEIYDQISNKMQKNCVLLDTPDHENIGDQLIWEGEEMFLNALNISPSYKVSCYHFDWRTFDDDTLILLHGGGNFGDIWPHHHQFRKKIIEKYKKNKIFMFPQSVEYKQHSQMLEDAELFSKHPNLTLCARDKYSYDLLKEHFLNEILLVPDMAFCIESTKVMTGDKKLYLKRKDREFNKKINVDKYKNYEIKDWPTFEMNLKNIFFKIIKKINRKFSKYIYHGKKGDYTFGFIKDNYNRKKYVKRGVEFLSQYDSILSTRLHGHILALLLGIPTKMIDNSYGKNSRFYHTWLKDLKDSSMIDS